MEGFSIQANGLKERENDPCTVAAGGGSISIPLYSLKTQHRVQQCLNIWLYNGMGECFDKRKKKGGQRNEI